MKPNSPTVKNVLAALPGMQRSIKDEIAKRITAGEVIASSDSGSFGAERKQNETRRAIKTVEKRKSAA